MAVGYVVADLEDVIRGKVKQYIESLAILRNTVRSAARKYLSELSDGGITPESDQFGEVPLRPEQFTGFDGNQLSGSFRQNVTSDGWQTILKADASQAGELKKAYVFGVVGLAILDAAPNISEIQMYQGDYTFPVFDVEECVAEGPKVLVFDISNSKPERFVFNPDVFFQLDAYITAAGYTTIKPIGLAAVPKDTAIKRTF